MTPHETILASVTVPSPSLRRAKRVAKKNSLKMLEIAAGYRFAPRHSSPLGDGLADPQVLLKPALAADTAGAEPVALGDPLEGRVEPVHVVLDLALRRE